MASAGVRKVVKVETAVKAMAGKMHYHCCTQCRGRFWDACTTPERAVACSNCRGGRTPDQRATWHKGMDPGPCCIDNCTQVTDGLVIQDYKLGGPGPWYQCRTCKRAHGYLPRETT